VPASSRSTRRRGLIREVDEARHAEGELERQDKIEVAAGSSYLRAVNDKARPNSVSNLPNIEQGTSVYACRVGMVFCRNVGDVLEVLLGDTPAATR
jgi:hypothetical protein